MPAPANTRQTVVLQVVNEHAGPPPFTVTDETEVDGIVTRHTYSGARTPGYWAIIHGKKPGVVLPLNNYRRSDYSCSPKKMSYSISYADMGYTAYGEVPIENWLYELPKMSTIAALATDFLYTDEQLVTSAAAGLTANVNVGPMLVDAKRTLGMLSDAVTATLGVVIGAVRRASTASAKVADTANLGRVLSDIRKDSPRVQANLDLAVQYGLRPLLNDIKDLLKMRDRIVASQGFGTVLRNVEKDSFSTSGSLVDTKTVSGNRIIQWETKYDLSVSRRGVAIGRLILPPHPSLGPLTTALDAIKLSFVLDWFVNIYQVLKLVENEIGISGRRTSIGSKVEILAVTRPTVISPGDFDTFVLGGGVVQRYRELSRRPCAPSYVPSLYPRGKLLSIGRALNLIDLMRQTGPRAKRPSIPIGNRVNQPDIPNSSPFRR